MRETLTANGYPEPSRYLLAVASHQLPGATWRERNGPSVRIDVAMERELREAQGLTQLRLAQLPSGPC
jgi:hypothetical protein